MPPGLDSSTGNIFHSMWVNVSSGAGGLGEQHAAPSAACCSSNFLPIPAAGQFCPQIDMHPSMSQVQAT
jgi:hypothetical protein